MNTVVTANKSSKPLERMKVSVAVLDTPENIEEKDRVGFFDENPIYCFDATKGGISFNPDRASQALQSNIFTEGVFTTLEAVKIGVDAMGGVAKNTGGDVFNALSDLVKIATGKDETEETQGIQQASEGEDASKIDPTVAKKQKEDVAYLTNRQRAEGIEAEILNIYRVLKNEAQLAPQRQEISDLMKLQAMLSGESSLMDKETGEERLDLQALLAQKRKEILASRRRQQASKNSLPSPAKHGAEGPRLSIDDNKSSETHSTAQTATG